MINKASPEWPGIRKWLEAQIEEKRNALESPNCGLKEGDFHRGRIMAYREMIAEVEPPMMEPIAAPAHVKGAGY